MSVREGVLARAREQAMAEARRVCWPVLLEAVNLHTDWSVLALWVRTITRQEGRLAGQALAEISHRQPELAAWINSRSWACTSGDPDHVATAVWDELMGWVNTYVFAKPAGEGWLHAVHYYSAMSPRLIKAWAHWGCIETATRARTVARFGSYEEWCREVDSVTEVGKPNTAAQCWITAESTLGAERLRSVTDRFFQMLFVASWMELLLEFHAEQTVAEELSRLYPSFELPGRESSPAQNARVFCDWELQGGLAVLMRQELHGGFAFYTQNHPRYVAVRNFAEACRTRWRAERPEPPPRLDDWLTAADTYYEPA